VSLDVPGQVVYDASIVQHVLKTGILLIVILRHRSSPEPE
jgi:hypothetical protein